MRRSPRLAAAAAVLVACGLVAATACSSPPDHPELAVQRSDTGALVVLYAGCDEQLEQVRLIEEWGEVEQDMLTATGDDLIPPTTEGAPTTVFVPRNALPPRIRIEVEGSDSFDVTFDPDDVPPVAHEVLVPGAAAGDEIVTAEAFTTRCA
jgi:hypothetical protein